MLQMPIESLENSADIMPVMRKHEGIWTGVYTHVDGKGAVIDRHMTRIVCEFPNDGEYLYCQHNLFQWEDGREARNRLPGRYADDKLWWDTPTFHGYAWETGDDVVMLNLTRKDEPGAYFIEAIILGQSGIHRSRTWHWFKDGKLYKRTLCEEQRVTRDVSKDDIAYTKDSPGG
ncbi:MAG: hypothetical protein AAF862_06155 [Pseudomonadota bacterium]